MDVINHRCAVLGHPIGHSLSPVLHQAAYKALGLADWHYERIDMVESGFPSFLQGLDDSWAGLSLTMPLKRTVMGFGKPCDRWSSELSVANTAILPSPGTIMPFDGTEGTRSTEHKPLRLFNTDVDGIRLAIAHALSVRGNAPYEGSGRPERLGVVILGNGNTALSALAATSTMAEHINVLVCARHPDAGAAMMQFAVRHRDHVELTSTPLSEAHDHLGDADIVISTLPAHAADPVARKFHERHRTHANDEAMLLDVAYDPRPSLLSRVWSQSGGIAIGGEEMLLYQAILQVHLMTMAGGASPTAGKGIPTTTYGDGPVDSDSGMGTSPQVDIRLEHAMRAALGEAL